MTERRWRDERQQHDEDWEAAPGKLISMLDELVELVPIPALALNVTRDSWTTYPRIRQVGVGWDLNTTKSRATDDQSRSVDYALVSELHPDYDFRVVALGPHRIVAGVWRGSQVNGREVPRYYEVYSHVSVIAISGKWPSGRGQETYLSLLDLVSGVSELLEGARRN